MLVSDQETTQETTDARTAPDGRAARGGRGGGGGRVKGRAARLLAVAGAAWLLYTVAHHWASGRVWPSLLLDLAPPVVFAAVPVLLLAAAWAPGPVRARRWTALAATASLLLGAGQLGFNPGAFGAFSAAPKPSGAADPVRVVSWNTEFWHQGDGADGFYRYLKERPADVYLLQEYVHWRGGPRRIDELARLRGEFPGFHIAVSGELVTLSRYPVLAQRPLRGSSLPPGRTGWHDYRTYKTLRTDLSVGGRELSVYNVHIPTPLSLEDSPFGGEFYGIVREQHAARDAHYRALTDDVAANSRPLVVAGDFNSTPAMGDVQRFGRGLEDAAAANESPFPASWPDGGPLPLLWRLDWAFTDDQVGVHRYGFRGADGMSDHRAQELLVSVEEAS